MAEQLKVFKHSKESNIFDSQIIVNNDTTQAVVKDVVFKIVNHEVYDTTTSISVDGISIADVKTAKENSNSIKLSGSMIVGENQTFSITTTKDYVANYLNNSKVVAFVGNNDTAITSIENTVNRNNRVAVDFESKIAPDLSLTTGSTSSIASASATAFIKNGIVNYAQIANGGKTVTTYKDDGSEIETYPDFTNAPTFIFNDGTYIYGWNGTSTLERIKISDATLDSTVVDLEGMYNCTTGVYYNGKVYVTQSYDTDLDYPMYIYDLATQKHSYIPFTEDLQGSANGYVAGALITVNTLGVPFYIICGDGYVSAVNLDTLETFKMRLPTSGRLSSDIYGNRQYELSSGVVAFVADNTYAIVSVNTGSLELIDNKNDSDACTALGFPTTLIYNQWCATAQIPLHEQSSLGDIVPVEIDTETIVSGVEITEVGA